MILAILARQLGNEFGSYAGDRNLIILNGRHAFWHGVRKWRAYIKQLIRITL